VPMDDENERRSGAGVVRQKQGIGSSSSSGRTTRSGQYMAASSVSTASLEAVRLLRSCA